MKRPKSSSRQNQGKGLRPRKKSENTRSASRSAASHQSRGDEDRFQKTLGLINEFQSPSHNPNSENFHLDPWQEQAIQFLDQDYSVVVDAPTTAGKTRIVEEYFASHIDQSSFRAAYTTPVKSLTNDKVREFREKFGINNVGIATGDIKENLGAKIVVATLESYRNSLLGVDPDLGRQLVIFDEYHYVQEKGRGSAWEEAIILTPKDCQILLLSASVKNGEEFCRWISELKGGEALCKMVETHVRPVPLTDLIFCREGGGGALGDHGRNRRHSKRKRHDSPKILPRNPGSNGHWLALSTIPKKRFSSLDREVFKRPLRFLDLADSMPVLDELGLTPLMIYCGKRLAIEHLAELLSARVKPLDFGRREALKRELDRVDLESSALTFMNKKLRKMIEVSGVGYHHSGLPAQVRMAIESLVKMGHLRFCTATMGLSLGINFSVKSALIADYSRPGEDGITDYMPSEVLQMLGRAGRRGKDAVGFSLWPSVEAYARLGESEREYIRSNLRIDPTTFLGLIGRGYSLRSIENFYNKSLLKFQTESTDFSIMTKTKLKGKLKAQPPCESPAFEWGMFLNENESSICFQCQLIKRCHKELDKSYNSQLMALYTHLNRISTLDQEGKLTDLGKVARYFPQGGGLMASDLLTHGQIHSKNLAAASELFAALSLARFKKPHAPHDYALPFSDVDVEQQLAWFYPHDLFPEVYDAPYGRRHYPVFREFNPKAGYAVKLWITGTSWKTMVREVTNDKFSEGDLMSLLYRTGSYLQSLGQAGLGRLSDDAFQLRKELLREPLAFALQV